MNELYEVLEICLQDIERGESIETVLFRYPEYADELRPILEGSMNARSMAISVPSPEVVRRNRAKVLQHAAQMREAQAKSSSRRIWFVSLRRVAVTLAVIAVLFVSGTGLVSAASTTLPGDNLYPVKRTWEDMLLMLTFNLQEREALEIERENTRLHELRELFAAGRLAEVEFSGVATSQNKNEWLIAGIKVIVNDRTEVRDGPLSIGSAVRVKGHTQGDGVVLAERVRLLDPDEKLPSEVEIEPEDHEDEKHQGQDNSGKGSDESTDGENKGSGSESDSNDDSSNSGSSSDNSGSGSNNNENDSNHEKSGSSNDDNSGSGKDDRSGSNDSGGGDRNSGSGKDDSSGGGDDSGGSGGGDDD